jgi:hypothetical protein
VRAFIESSEERVVVEDVPDGIVDLFEGDVLVVEGLAEEVLPRVQAKGAGAADFADFEVAGVLGRRKTLRIGPG